MQGSNSNQLSSPAPPTYISYLTPPYAPDPHTSHPQSELEEALKQREQLVLAEKLFDMPITSYPLLAQLEGEQKKLQQVYAVYAEHAEAVRQYAQMLWSELDVGKMMASTEEVANKLRKLKQFKLMPTYELVEKEIQGFISSLPLMKELKSDALRWAACVRML